jgi:hypothetical protein
VSQSTFSSSDVWRGRGNLAAPFCFLSALFYCGFGEFFKEFLDNRFRGCIEQPLAYAGESSTSPS